LIAKLQIIFEYNKSVVQHSGCLLFFYISMKKEQLLKKLGKRICEIRKAKGMTQVDLANSIGKDQQSLQRLEAGKINPSFYYLFEVAKGLDIEIEELLKGLK